MRCAARRLGHAQHEVPVLRAVDARRQSAELAQRRRPHDHEVQHAIGRADPLAVPGRLEVRHDARAVLGQLVLVGKQENGVALRIDRLGHAQQRIGGEAVVVVQKGAILAARLRQRVVGRPGDAAVDRPPRDADARIGLRRSRQAVANAGGGRRVVDDDELPVPVNLRAHRRERFLEERDGDVPHGQQDRDQRLVRQCLDPRGWIGAGRGLESRAPRRVIGILRRLDDMAFEHAGKRAFAREIDGAARDPQQLARVAPGVAQVTLEHAQAGAQMGRADHGHVREGRVMGADDGGSLLIGAGPGSRATAGRERSTATGGATGPWRRTANAEARILPVSPANRRVR